MGNQHQTLRGRPEFEEHDRPAAYERRIARTPKRAEALSRCCAIIAQVFERKIREGQ